MGGAMNYNMGWNELSGELPMIDYEPEFKKYSNHYYLLRNFNVIIQESTVFSTLKNLKEHCLQKFFNKRILLHQLHIKEYKIAFIKFQWDVLREVTAS